MRFKRSERSISDSGQICWRTTILARQVLPRFHTRIPILSFCHASKFLCASSTQRFVDSSKIYTWNAFSSLAFVFLSILIITIGATRTREEFRESREIDTYAYTLGKYVHMACVFRETHPRKCLQIFKWQTCV